MKFVVFIKKTEGLENLIHTGHLERKRVKRKQRLTYVTSLCKRLTEQRLGDMAERKHLLRYKGQEIAGREDRPHLKG